MLIISGVLLLSMGFDGETSHPHHDWFHPAQRVARVTTPTAAVVHAASTAAVDTNSISRSAKLPRNPQRYTVRDGATLALVTREGRAMRVSEVFIGGWRPADRDDDWHHHGRHRHHHHRHWCDRWGHWHDDDWDSWD